MLKRLDKTTLNLINKLMFVCKKNNGKLAVNMFLDILENSISYNVTFRCLFYSNMFNSSLSKVSDAITLLLQNDLLKIITKTGVYYTFMINPYYIDNKSSKDILDKYNSIKIYNRISHF